jgi:mannose-1-phosphate guanylyltransferase
MNRYAVIMAGGGGTRFWPLSRKGKPKQFLDIDGSDVLINSTIKRLGSHVPAKNIFIVTGESLHDLIHENVSTEIPRENIIYEPEAKNTAAAIAYAAVVIKHRHGEGIMCVLPSDHHISEQKNFEDTIEKAFKAAHTTRKLYTIGIEPTFCSTGYGYIKHDPDTDKIIDGAYEVEEFIEKPSIEKAKIYCDSDNFLWNSGIFIWRISTIMTNIERYLPKLYKGVMQISEHLENDDSHDVIKEVYGKLKAISIDYGILERSEDVWVLPADLGWSDIGSWDSMAFAYKPDGDNNVIVKSKHVGINSRNNIIFGDNRLITAIDLEDYIIADTNDALLICPRDKAQEVKYLVGKIKEKGLDEYL